MGRNGAPTAGRRAGIRRCHRRTGAGIRCSRRVLLRDVIAGGKELVGIEQIQLGLIGMQLALTALWRSYGVTPDAVIGHSMGEVAAAVVAGALTPAQGLRVTAVRSRLMAPLSGQGTMALLELDAEATEALIADYPEVSLGIYASHAKP